MLTLIKADWNNMTWEEAVSNPLNAYRASKAFSVCSQALIPHIRYPLT